MNKCRLLWFNLYFQRLIFDLKVLIFWLESLVFGVEGTIGCLFSSPRTVRCFLLVEREGLLVERECLDLECWSSRLRACLCAWSLNSGSSIFFLLFLEEKVLILKAFLFERESFNLGERKRDLHFGVILSSLRMASLTWWPFKLKGVGVYL